jgi:hypothetical protein
MGLLSTHFHEKIEKTEFFLQSHPGRNVPGNQGGHFRHDRKI